MTVAEPDARGSTTVHLHGDIDVDNAAAIGDQLVEVLGRASGNVVVDCSGITFVESRGLAMMARVQRSADDAGCRLSWQALPLHVLRSIHLTGLDRYLRIEA
jgi:anti-sigma B factor antagonist